MKKKIVHVIDLPCHKYKVYKGDDNKMAEFFLPFLIVDFPSQASYEDQPYLDLCFRHMYYEVDYSIV